MLTMLKQQSSRGFIAPRARPKTLLFLALAIVTVYFLATRGAPAGYHVVPWNQDGTSPPPEKAAPPEPPKSEEERKQDEERQKQEREKHEQDLRDEFAREYEAAKKYVPSCQSRVRERQLSRMQERLTFLNFTGFPATMRSTETHLIL